MITIVYHERYFDTLKNYIKHCKDFIEYRILSDSNILQCWSLPKGQTKVQFLSVEMLEQYKYCGIFLEQTYYPSTERNNKRMMDTIIRCTRGIEILRDIGYFNYIQEYNEEYMMNHIKEI